MPCFKQNVTFKVKLLLKNAFKYPMKPHLCTKGRNMINLSMGKEVIITIQKNRQIAKWMYIAHLG